MARSKARLWWILALLVLLALGVWLATQLTWEEESIEGGFSEAALLDDYLAAAQFLQLQGIQAHTLRSLAALDRMGWRGESFGREDTLILEGGYRTLRGERLSRVLDWVDSGGTVIVSTRNPFIGVSHTPDPLFARFQIMVDEERRWRREASGGSAACARPEETPENGAEELVQDNQAVLTEGDAHSASDLADERQVDDSYCHPRWALQETELGGENLLVDYSQGRLFAIHGDLPDLWAGSDWGLFLAAFAHGEGRVIVNSDNRIWGNRRIACHDHAYLLWQLINPQGQVWFLVNQDSPSLWAMIRQGSPLGVWAALLALFLWLWASAARFGPVLTRAAEGRRSLAEHIRASAQLLWRRRQHPHLVALLREQVQREIQRHLPGFELWDRERQMLHLTQLSGLSVDLLERALYAPDLQHPHDFTRAVACLQTLRKQL